MGEVIFEYLKSNYFMLFYAICLALSLKKYPFYFNSRLKFLPILIAYTFLSELLGFFILEFDSIQIVSIEEYNYANNLIFNIYDLIFFYYFYFIFWNTFKVTLHKNLIKGGAIFYLVASMINPFYQDFIIFPQMYAYSIGSFVLFSCILLYFLEIKQNWQNKNELLVWLSIGLFIFYLFFPFILVTGILKYEWYKSLGLRQLHHLLIAAMYTCFIIGFIKVGKKPFHNSIS